MNFKIIMQDARPDLTAVFTDEGLVPAVRSINIILDQHSAIARVEYYDTDGEIVVEDLPLTSLELEAFSQKISNDEVLYVDAK